MFVENLFQVKPCGAEDTEMNRTGSSPEGVHSNRPRDIGEKRTQDMREEGDGELGRDFSRLRVQGQLCEGRP